MNTRARIRFQQELDKTLLGRHPLTGLPIDVMAGLGDDLANNNGVFSYVNHFFSFEGPLAEGVAAGWTLTGATGTATVALSTVARGEIVLTADATGSCNPLLTHAPAATGHSPYIYQPAVSAPPAPWKPAKKLWMFVKMKPSSVANMSIFAGFGTPGTDPSTTANLPTAGIFMRKDVADTDMTLSVRHAGVSTSKTAMIGTAMLDATYVTIGFVVDVDGNVMPYTGNTIRNTKAIAHGDANMPISTDVMVPMIGFLGASRTLTLDFVAFGMEL